MSRTFTLPGGTRLIGEILQQPLEPSQRRAWTWMAWHRGNEGGCAREGVTREPLAVACVRASRRQEDAAPAPSVDPAAFTAKVRAKLRKRRLRTRVAEIAGLAATWLRRALCSSGLRMWT